MAAVKPAMTKPGVPTAGDQLKAQYVRSDWYRDQFRNAWKIIYALVVLLLILAGTIAVMFMRWPEPVAYGLTPDLRAIPLQPLSEELPAEDVRQWAAKMVVKAYTLDYAHFKDQLNNLEPDFTPDGYEGFLEGLKRSNLQDQITLQSYVVTGVVTAVPSIIRKGLQNGVYAWVIKVPMKVTYQSGPTSNTQNLTVTLIANRVLLTQNPSGIAVKNLLSARQ